MHVLNLIQDLEKIESSLGPIAIMTSDKELKKQFFLARKSIHNAICSLLEDKEDSPRA